MESRDGDLPDGRPHARELARTLPVLLVTLVMILSVSAPVAAGPVADDRASSTGALGAQGDDASPEWQWTDLPTDEDGEANETDGETNETVAVDRRAAIEAGVDDAVATLQRQGVSVNQSQRAAAVEGNLAAVAQRQNASVEQIQNASYGAVTGTFLQSGNVSVEQVQNATAGGASGALSQHQNASAYQLQHAAHGATHGAVAQRANATVDQIRIVAQGAAAGAAHEAGKHDGNDRKRAHPGAIREAAQGAAFGALSQEQNVTVDQRQHAAAGAAEGALNQSQSVRAEQDQTAATGGNRTASVKQIQVAAMGAAKGALSGIQRQEVTVRHVQSAARGACKGSLAQVQQVSITQIQQSAFGAAKGAISQSQRASVTQIQAAATGGAEGAIVQRQTVSITHVQYAAAGAAKGAARSAAQNQVVNLRQVQAAAMGAGQGSIVQLQRINVVQIQVISQSAADGALSQHQTANVVQLQSAARGASEGATALTQRQDVTIEQTQRVTQRAAANTAATAAELNIDVDVTIVNHAKGAAEDPEDDDADEEELRSLFVSAQQDAIFLANPNDVSVTVTITNEAGDVETITLGPGESTTEDRQRGTYTLTSETADGEDVELAGRAELTVSVGEALQSLTGDVDDGRLSVENPTDERVTVDVSGDVDASFDVPGHWEESLSLGPGTYTATAETRDGDSVGINGEDVFEFAIEPEEPAPDEPEPIDLTASVENGTLTVENPSETDVTATATPDEGETRTFDVPAGETVEESFEPGTYTMTGDAEVEREVLIEGESTFAFSIEAEEPEPGPIDLNASVENGTLTVENPSDADVEATVTSADGEEAASFDVPVGENVTESFDPGTYALRGTTTDEREVLIEGQSAFEFAVEAAGPIDLQVTVDGQNVSTENPSDADVTVTATHEATGPRTIDVGAGETATATLPAGNHTLAGESDDDRDVHLDGESELRLRIEAPPPVVEGVNVSVQNGTVTLENPNDEAVTVTANATAAGNRTVEVGPGSTVTEQLDPGNYSLTAATADGTAVPLNEQPSYEFSVAPDEPAATGTLAVADQAGDGSAFVVENASASVPYVVEFDYDAGTGISEPVEAGESLANATFALEPPIESDGPVAVTLRAAETDEPLASETVTYEAVGPTANVSVADQPTDGSALVVESANLTAGGFLAVHEASPNGTEDVLGNSTHLAPGEHENVSVALEPPLSSDATVNVTAHRDTNANATFDFVGSLGAEDVPYANVTGDPVSTAAALTVEAAPEPEVTYENCTSVRVNGTYDRLNVTLGYYATDGNATSHHVRTGVDVPGDRPVVGSTLVTVGEVNETRVADNGTLIVRIADPGAFGDADPTAGGGADAVVGDAGPDPFGDAGPGADEAPARSFVANVSASESSAGETNLTAAHPETAQCRENVRPEAPTVDVDVEEVLDNETALLNLSYENPNDAPMVPAESGVTNGTVATEPPAVLDPGQQLAVVEWTPASPDERVIWTANLSNFDLGNASTTSPPATDVPGLLEPPEEDIQPPAPEGQPEDVPQSEDTPTPTPDEPGEEGPPVEDPLAPPLEEPPVEAPDETPTPENGTA